MLETPRGPARAHLDRPAADPAGLLVLGHGAGGGVDAADLRAVRDAVVGAGLAVARVQQPYRVAGRRAPPPARHLDEVWCAVVEELRRESPWNALPLIVGGRSSGARVACRTATLVGAAGVLALAFPLHPPGRPERSRADELSGCDAPVLVVNGDRDRFGVPEPSPGVTIRVLTGETHALGRKPAAVADEARRWVTGLIGERPARHGG